MKRLIFVFIIGICFVLWVKESISKELQPSQEQLKEFVHQYIMAYFKTGDNIQEIEERFGPNGIIASMSTEDFYRKVVSRDTISRNGLIDIVNDGLETIVNIESVNAFSINDQRVDFTVKTIERSSGKVKKDIKLTADLRIQCDPLGKDAAGCKVTAFGITRTKKKVVCKEKEFIDDSGKVCHGCFDTGGYLASAEECAKCSNREMKGYLCSYCNEGEFLSGELCFSCSDHRDIQITLSAETSECLKCPNRSMRGSSCVLNKPKPPDVSKIVVNNDKKRNLPVCDFVYLPSEKCLLYILNDTNQGKIVEDFFEEVAQKTQRSINRMRVDNVLYSKQVIPPGFFAEIIVSP